MRSNLKTLGCCQYFDITFKSTEKEAIEFPPSGIDFIDLDIQD